MSRNEKPEVFIALLYAPQRLGPQIWTTNKIFVLMIHHTTQHTHTHTRTHTHLWSYIFIIQKFKTLREFQWVVIVF